MTPLADTFMIGDALGVLLSTGLFLATLVQWLRHRHCAYHVDTGYWMMLTFGFFFIAAGYAGRFFLSEEMLGLYTALCLHLTGYLAIAVALLRLFSWNAHRHTDTP